MSALIEEFKREHSEIVETFKEAEELGILTKEGRAKLMSVKSSLYEHFNKEEERLYPFFYKAAEQNEKLKEGLEVFEKDLESVSKVLFRFFDSFDKGLLSARLLKDFETLFLVLRYRMWNEENYLYVEYEELDNQ